jgi:TolA-binding protein
MKPGSCARLFEAEAMRDGRLGDAELASFGRHLDVCPVCLREVRALEALAEGLRAPPPEADEDELRAQRGRTQLLAAFHRGQITSAPRRDTWRRLLWPAVAAGMLGALLITWWVRPAAQVVPPPTVVVQSHPAAVWSKRAAGDREEITLQRGTLWIRVEGSRGHSGLVVKLPDGELVDRGTTFTVDAEDGRTTRVEVQEGSVELRRRGQPPVVIGAGGRWAAPAQVSPAQATAAQATAAQATAAQAAATVDSTPELAPPLPQRATPVRADRQRRSPPPARVAAGAPSSPPTPAPASAPPPPEAPTPVVPDPAADFRAAVAALDAGDNQEAAAAFARFVYRHPDDRRVEDAAYLRVIALQRLGDHQEMQRAAMQYLRRHPTGFRRHEVERLGSIPQPPR